jgi:phage-related protein
MAYILALLVCMVYGKVVAMATGNDRMVAVNVMVPRHMKEALDAVARADRRTLAETVRMALEKLIAERKGT